MNDEKDARGYLQALASKMSDELESLKHTGGGASAGPAAVSLMACPVVCSGRDYECIKYIHTYLYIHIHTYIWIHHEC